MLKLTDVDVIYSRWPGKAFHFCTRNIHNAVKYADYQCVSFLSWVKLRVLPEIVYTFIE
jgi:hypothetical protein